MNTIKDILTNEKFEVGKVSKQYQLLLKISKAFSLEIPTYCGKSSMNTWKDFWFDLSDRVYKNRTKAASLGINYFKEFKEMQIRVQFKIKDLAKILISECNPTEWTDKIHRGYESFMIHMRKRYSDGEEWDWLDCVKVLSPEEVGYYLIWKNARNIISHQEYPENKEFLDDLRSNSCHDQNVSLADLRSMIDKIVISDKSLLKKDQAIYAKVRELHTLLKTSA